MRILIIGRNEVLYDTAKFLSKEHTIAAIITAPGAPEYHKNEKDFEDLAEELNCPFLLTNSINDKTLKLIEEVKPDIGVSINWISIIKDNLISLVPKGVLNCHPSLLPRFKGNSATNWSLILGEKEIGLTVHFMDKNKLDSGDILCQKKMQISDTTTINDIHYFWRKNAPSMFLESIRGISERTIIPVSQASIGNGFRAYPRLPVYSKINWNKSAKEINRLVRASVKPYSGAYSYLKVNNEIKKLFIWKTRVEEESTSDIGIPGHIIHNNVSSGESFVYTGKGILAILIAQFEGESAFKPGETWKTIRMRFGVDVEEELINILKKINETQ